MKTPSGKQKALNNIQAAYMDALLTRSMVEEQLMYLRLAAESLGDKHLDRRAKKLLLHGVEL